MCSETLMDQAAPNLQVKTDTLQSPEKNALTLLLLLVQDFKLEAGEVIQNPQLSGAWYDKQKSQEDLVTGLEYAKAQQWLVSEADGFALTRTGQDAITRLQAGAGSAEA